MSRAALAAVLAALAAPAWGGTALPSFEGAVHEMRASILSTRAEQIKVKTLSAKNELENLSHNVRRHDWEAGRLRRKISDIRRRVNRMGPDQPRRPDSDPFLRNDIRRLVRNLRDFVRKVERSQRRAEALANTVQKAPDLVRPAERLERNARAFVSEARWLENEARWARWDIRRAGFTFEAIDIERYSDEAHRAARRIKTAAGRILKKVR